MSAFRPPVMSSREDELAGRIASRVEQQFGSDLGRYSSLRLDIDDDMPQDDPDATWLVRDREGHRFEVEFEVTVTELTDGVLAARAAELERLRKLRAEIRAKS